MAYIIFDEYPFLITESKYYTSNESVGFLIHNVELIECHRIIVSIIIEKDGTISNKKIVVPSKNDLCNFEALKIVDLMKKWQPGKVSGKNVRSKHTLILNFKSS